MESLHVFLVIASLLTMGGAAVVAGNTEQTEAGQLFISSDDGFKIVIQEDAEDIFNAVNNVLTGREEPETVKQMIITEYKGTQRDSKYSAEEIEINTAYQTFLKEAYTVLEVYEAGQAPDLAALTEAKNKL